MTPWPGLFASLLFRVWTGPQCWPGSFERRPEHVKRYANKIRDSSQQPPHVGRLFSCPGGFSAGALSLPAADRRGPCRASQGGKTSTICGIDPHGCKNDPNCQNIDNFQSFYRFSSIFSAIFPPTRTGAAPAILLRSLKVAKVARVPKVAESRKSPGFVKVANVKQN